MQFRAAGAPIASASITIERIPNAGVRISQHGPQLARSDRAATSAPTARELPLMQSEPWIGVSTVFPTPVSSEVHDDGDSEAASP